MGYLVLARKFRPQNFSEVYAQDHITKILQNTIELDRTAHAYLFTGPRGVGKTSLARIFAKSLNCLTGGPTTHPCNTCQNCLEITNGTSADVIEIDGASNTGVDDIRDLQRELMYSTTNANYKIYIIDEVHMLSKNAFNALLKTLEEPPNNVIFIFATTEPHKVLPTIISRCQRFDFKRIPIPAIIQRLRFICKAEKVEIADEALFIIAKKADGSMRDALSLMDQVLAYSSTDITAEDVLSIFGIVHNDVYHAILKGIKAKDATAILKKVHGVLEEGNDIQEFINGLLDYIRNILLTKIGMEVNEVSGEYLKLIIELSKQFSENEMLYLMTLLVKAKTDIKNSNNPILIAEMSFVKIARLAEMTSLENLVEKLSSGKMNLGGQPETQTGGGETQPHHLTGQNSSLPRQLNKPGNQFNVSASNPMLQKKKIPEPVKREIKQEAGEQKPRYEKITQAILDQEFDMIIRKIGKEKIFLPPSFKSISNTTVTNRQITFYVSDKFNFHRLNSERVFVGNVFSQHFNMNINVNFKIGKLKEVVPRMEPTDENMDKHSPQTRIFINDIGGEIVL